MSLTELRRTPHPSGETLARALAYGFLSAPNWNRAELSAQGTIVLGVKRRWLAVLVDEVLAIYPRPPRDAPRELAAAVWRSEVLHLALEAAAERGSPIEIRRYLAVPTEARPGADRSLEPSGLPRLDSLADLAALLGISVGELEWFADTKQWNRTAPQRLQHYRYEWRIRAGRVPRLLEIPEQRMRAAQRTVLDEVLAQLPVHDAAHGFVAGRNVLSGASEHQQQAVVISLDLASFFARVQARRIYAVLRQAGFAEPVAHRITGICTHAVPRAVLAAMPDGGASAERFALRQALTVPHLPQGAPSSPMLANLAVYRLDQRLAGWAAAAGARYTRYADDLSFSGGPELLKRSEAFVRGVQRIVQDEGHRLNEQKTRVRHAGMRQSVTGIVVNEHPNVARAEFDRLKATLHNCVLHGPQGQNHANHDDFRAHLRGRIVWVESVNPARGARLRQSFERIVW